MSPRHHLDPSTLVSFAAGALPPEVNVVVATHLDGCATCRKRIADAERIGGALVEHQQPAAARLPNAAQLRERMLARLDSATDVPARAAPPVVDVDRHDPDRLPAPLHPYFGTSYRALRWRWMSPGVHCIRSPQSANLLLLKIAPGKSMPLHSHGASEVTQILQGAYDDALGHFAPGDVADLDSDIEHQPVTTPGTACICVSALDAPLEFRGWIARKLQPLFKL
ncbi:transcriptional regulator [Luteimonas aestuarii]|uniref:Transcriptional regulator n=1 Tax=Luteimonas aestuarii TaxID=453837 RepID=A0A4R5U0T9_9GAMM|nr:ChrR family anti-sigma-E factor [Luteimonas aestuarii]TDK27190.1 transcriptional regulator [Luteimonas aestuarii]